MRHPTPPPACPIVVLVLLALGLSTAPLDAQRQQATFKLDRHTSVIDYAVARFGKHGIDELPENAGSWWLGSSQPVEGVRPDQPAPTWRTELPILAGDALLAPGEYRVRLLRSKSGFVLEPEEASNAIGEAQPLHMKCEPGSGPQADKLDVQWRPAPPRAASGNAADDSPNREQQIVVRFGPQTLVVPVTVLAAQAVGGVPGFDVLAFAVPAPVLAARLEAGRGTVVATLRAKSKRPRGEPDAFNLVLTKERAQLVPAMQATTDMYGFGTIAAPAADWTFDAEQQWSDADEAQPFLKMRQAKAVKGRLELQLTCGARSATVSCALPTKPVAR